MLWLARLLLLRVLPRKLLPILTVWEVWKIVRGQQETWIRAPKRGGSPPGPPRAVHRPAEFARSPC